jgi:hypothetical protein
MVERTPSATDVAKALERVSLSTNPKELTIIAKNAARLGLAEVKRAAERRLFAVLPSADPTTLEYSVWQSIHALEATLTEERGRTTRLSRTRQKIMRDGEHKTVADLVRGTMSEGFTMLIERGMPDLTFEAVALKHAADFEADVLEAAKRRLSAAGVNPH